MASKTRIFFTNALSLALTALFIRGVGVAFNIYISNRAGSEAIGLFSLLGSVYGFAITLATAGINLGTTRLVSDALGIGDTDQARKAAAKALCYCTVTGATSALLLFTFAYPIGKILLGDIRTVTSLRILALTLVPIAVCSCLSGYFTAVRRVKITAAFQIFVQMTKISATVLLMSIFIDPGTEGSCIAIVSGGAISEFVSLIITYALYRRDVKVNLKKGKNSQNNYPARDNALKKLLGITLPVTFSACVRSALNMIQHVLIPKGLKACGNSWSQALSSYGALHGMAMPVILFPSAFLSSFSGMLIPEISECCVQNNKERLRRTSFRALTLALFFSIGISGIMVFFSKELGLVIYGSEETAKYIRIMAPLIPVMYIDSTVDAILKGSGHQVYSMNVNIADALSSCIFAITLIPRIGIWGYIISIYATELLNTTLSLIKMISVSGIRPRPIHQVFMPVICVIGATNIISLVFRFLPLPFGGIIKMIIILTFSALAYLLLLKLSGTIGKDEDEFLKSAFKIRKKTT